MKKALAFVLAIFMVISIASPVMADGSEESQTYAQVNDGASDAAGSVAQSSGNSAAITGAVAENAAAIAAAAGVVAVAGVVAAVADNDSGHGHGN